MTKFLFSAPPADDDLFLIGQLTFHKLLMEPMKLLEENIQSILKYGVKGTAVQFFKKTHFLLNLLDMKQLKIPMKYDPSDAPMTIFQMLYRLPQMVEHLTFFRNHPLLKLETALANPYRLPFSDVYSNSAKQLCVQANFPVSTTSNHPGAVQILSEIANHLIESFTPTLDNYSRAYGSEVVMRSLSGLVVEEKDPHKDIITRISSMPALRTSVFLEKNFDFLFRYFESKHGYTLGAILISA